MDLKWFLRYLTLHRWARFVSVVAACLVCIILANFFFGLQKDYKQKEWQFINTGVIINGLTLEPNTIYKVSWKNDDATPTQVYVNDVAALTQNHFSLPRAARILNKYCDIYFPNPTYIRVRQPTPFKLYFVVYPHLNWGGGFWSFFKSWLKSFKEPVADTHWTVEDVTDEYTGPLTIDGSFPIVTINR